MKLPKFFKRILTTGLAVAVAIGVAGCGGSGGSDSGENFIRIATGGTAGTYYPIGGAIADVISKDIPGMSATAQSTGASVANINMIRDGQVDLAIVQNDVAYYALNGTDMFDTKFDGLRGIASLYPETCQFVTREDSGITSIAGLRGKKVAVGAAGSGVEANVRQILKIYGITYEDIDAKFLSFAEGASALKDGSVDVACLTAGYPTASVQDVASMKKIRIIPIEDDKIESLIKDYPFYTPTVIPAGSYQGLYEDVKTVSVMAILVASDKVNEDTGYKIAKSIFGHLDKISAAHPAAEKIKKDTATAGLDFIKMNEGAAKFFKE